MTRPDISASMQDYLEAILELSDRDGNARVTDIAASLSIAKASVSQTISKLKEMGLVTQESYGPVNLTADGKDWAIKIRHQHRILRRFLIEILGVKPEIA